MEGNAVAATINNWAVSTTKITAANNNWQLQKQQRWGNNCKKQSTERVAAAVRDDWWEQWWWQWQLECGSDKKQSAARGQRKWGGEQKWQSTKVEAAKAKHLVHLRRQGRGANTTISKNTRLNHNNYDDVSGGEVVAASNNHLLRTKFICPTSMLIWHGGGYFSSAIIFSIFLSFLICWVYQNFLVLRHWDRVSLIFM